MKKKRDQRGLQKKADFWRPQKKATKRGDPDTMAGDNSIHKKEEKQREANKPGGKMIPCGGRKKQHKSKSLLEEGDRQGN